jgi:hypothetical protein
VASATYFAKVCAVPKMVSSDFGKLEVSRHLISGEPCAMEGAAISVDAPASALPLRNVRRFMMCLLPLHGGSLRAGEMPIGDRFAAIIAKSGARVEALPCGPDMT